MPLNTLYIGSILFGIVVSIGSWLLIWHRRQSNGARLLLFLISGSIIWLLSLVFTAVFEQPATRLFWIQIRISVGVLLPPIWLIFALKYVGRLSSARSVWLTLLFIFPIFIVIAIFANPISPLIIKNINLFSIIPYIYIEFGPILIFMSIYGFIVSLIGIFVLVVSFWDSMHTYQQQIQALIIAAAIPVFFVLLDLSGITRIDLTPLAVVLANLIIALAFFPLNDTSLTSLGHATIFQQLTEGILVLDNEQRVIYCNTQALTVLQQDFQNVAQQPLQLVNDDLAELVTTHTSEPAKSKQTVEYVRDSQTYLVKIKPLLTRSDTISATIITLHDITELENRKSQLTTYMERLQFLRLLDQLIARNPLPTTLAESVIPLLRTIIPANFVTMVLFRTRNKNARILAMEPFLSDFSLNAREVFTEEVKKMIGILRSGHFTVRDTSVEPPVHSQDRILFHHGIKQIVDVPLISSGTLIGTISFGFPTTQTLTSDQSSFLNEIGDTLSNAINFALSNEKNQQEHFLSSTLLKTSLRINQALSEPNILTLILKQLREMLEYDSASFFTLEGKTLVKQTQVSSFPEPDKTQQLFALDEYPHMQEVILSKTAVIIPNTNEDPRWANLAYMDQAYTWLGVPLLLGQDVIGLLNITKARPYSYDEGDANIAMLFALRATTSIHNARLLEMARKRSDELEAIAQFSTTLRTLAAPNEILSVTLDACIALLNGIGGAIWIFNPEQTTYTVRLVKPKSLAIPEKPLELAPELLEQLSNNRIVNVPILADLDFEECLIIPLKNGIDLIGAVLLTLPADHAYGTKQMRILTAVSEIAGNALDRAILLETLEMRVAKRTTELAKANLQLQNLDKLKSKFVADMSHELRTPVTNVRLYADLLEVAKLDKQAHYLTILREQAERLTKLAEDISMIARIDTVHTTFNDWIDINTIIDHQLQMVTDEIEQNQNEIELNLYDDLPLINGDKTDIFIIVNSLLDNAVKYTSNGRITINTFYNADKESIVLQVTDTGMGIHPDDLPHVLQRFYRGQQVAESTISGTGLGLALARELTEIYGGVLWIDSEYNVGTKVTVTLPITESAP